MNNVTCRHTRTMGIEISFTRTHFRKLKKIYYIFRSSMTENDEISVCVRVCVRARGERTATTRDLSGKRHLELVGVVGVE